MVILRSCYKKEDYQNELMDILDNINIDEIFDIPFKGINKVYIKKIEDILAKVGENDV
jgi:hypothetical protein